jgi:hypothetical protein
MRLGVALALILACAACPARAAADECIVGWTISLDVPKDGATVRPSTRFRVLEYEGCSSIEGGPRHAFRLQNGAGDEIPSDAVPWANHTIEMTPRAPLAPGAAALWVRRPATKDTLGPWEPLSRVTVAGAPDTTPPAFDGIASGEAAAVEGHVALSPCESVPGWELKTRLRFAPASDAESGHDDLLYRLERVRGSSSEWEEVTTLRPSPDGDRMAFEWESESGWSEVWSYRMSVRDMAGHETQGARRVTVQNPPRPARELWDPDDRHLPTTDPARCFCQAPGAAAPGSRAATVLLGLLAALGGARRKGRPALA